VWENWLWTSSFMEQNRSQVFIFIQRAIPGETSPVFVEPEENVLNLLVKFLDLLLHPLSCLQQFVYLGFGVHLRGE
jgi:hypothetical protein